MTYGTRTDHYPPSSKLLHWLVAACVLATAPVAVAMVRVGSGPLQDALYNLHKSLGVLIFVFMLLRLINRLALGAPRTHVLWAAARVALVSAAAGMVIGVAVDSFLGAVLAHWMQNAFAAGSLFAAAALLALSAVLACLLPARHAIAVPPAEALRNE